MQGPAVKKALTTLEFLSQDEEARRRYEERQKALQSYLSAIEGAKEEGREEGMAIGMERGREEGDRNARKELAMALLEMGDSVEKVIKVTKLSQEEVEAIRRQLLQ